MLCYFDSENIFITLKLTLQAPDEAARQFMLESLFVEVTQDSDIDTTHVAQRTAVSRHEMLYTFSHNHTSCEKISGACR